METLTLTITPNLSYILEGSQALLDSWLEGYNLSALELTVMMAQDIADITLHNIPHDHLLPIGEVITITSYGSTCMIRDYDKDLMIYGIMS